MPNMLVRSPESAKAKPTRAAKGSTAQRSSRRAELPKAAPAKAPKASRRAALPAAEEALELLGEDLEPLFVDLVAPPESVEVEVVRCPLSAREAMELVEQYAPLVKRIAGGFQRKLPRNVLRDDLIAAGMSGLWDAIRRHSEHRTESFEWYVRVRIRGAILDELRTQDWLPRRARAAAEGGQKGSVPFVVRFDDVSEWEQNRSLMTGDSSNSELAVVAKFATERLVRAVEELPARERHIVSMHYFKGVRFKDLGAELGVSEPRVSQLHSRAMQRLRVILDNAA